MQIYITDASERKFWNTNVSDEWGQGERSNQARRLACIKSGHSEFANMGIDAATARIVEEYTEAEQSARDSHYLSVMELARSNGFDGFGGNCGSAAYAIKYVLIPQGKLIAAVNKAFWEQAGLMIGHIAVESNAGFYDADGKRKDWEEIEHWGMLDFSDSNWIDQARDHGVDWNENASFEVVRIEVDIDDAPTVFGPDRSVEMTMLLREAIQCLKSRQNDPDTDDMSDDELLSALKC